MLLNHWRGLKAQSDLGPEDERVFGPFCLEDSVLQNTENFE